MEGVTPLQTLFHLNKKKKKKTKKNKKKKQKQKNNDNKKVDKFGFVASLT